MATDDGLKRYFSIGEVAERLGVNASQLRFWEGEFGHIKPNKNSRGERRFTKDNIAQLELVQYLLKDRGFTIEGARREIAARRRGGNRKKEEVLQRLLAVRGKLAGLLEEE